MKSNSHALSQNILRGVCLILAATLIISIQDVVIKFYSSEVTLWQLFSLRGALAVPMLVVALFVRGHSIADVISAALSPWTLLRSILVTSTLLSFYIVLPFISLSTAGAAVYVAPIIVAVISAFFLKRKIKLFGWAAVMLGFTGGLLLLQPGSDAFTIWTLVPLAGAVIYAVAHITTHTKCQAVSLGAMALSLNLVMMLAGLLVSLLLFLLKPQAVNVESTAYILGNWSVMHSLDWLILAVLAGFAIVISMLMAGAYQSGPPAIVATFEYSYLVFVLLWDMIFFSTVPTWSSGVGMLAIILAGLLILRLNEKQGV